MRERSWVPTTFSSSSTLFSPGAADARLRLQFFDYPSGATPVSALNATVEQVTNFRICSISLYGKRRGEQRDISTSCSDEELSSGALPNIIHGKETETVISYSTHVHGPPGKEMIFAAGLTICLPTFRAAAKAVCGLLSLLHTRFHFHKLKCIG